MLRALSTVEVRVSPESELIVKIVLTGNQIERNEDFWFYILLEPNDNVAISSLLSFIIIIILIN